jgi:Ca2+-binding EF-hand superfamily protein
MTDEEIASMLEHGNKSGKPGKGVSFDDFYRLMKKKAHSGALNEMLGDDD